MEETSRNIFAENLKYFMDKQGKTRNDICSDLNLRYTTVTDWLKGKTYPRIEKIELLAKYFNVSKSDLIENSLINQTSSLARNIKHYRKLMNLSQKDLSKKLNVSPTSVSAWEVGRNQPLLSHIKQMVSIFNVEYSDFIGDMKMNSDVGSRIRSLRIRSGIEQKELADILGYKSDTTISKWEKGINLPSGGKLTKLAKILNTSVDFILYGGNFDDVTLDLKDFINKATFFGNTPLSDDDKDIILGIISGYINHKK